MYVLLGVVILLYMGFSIRIDEVLFSIRIGVGVLIVLIDKREHMEISLVHGILFSYLSRIRLCMYSWTTTEKPRQRDPATTTLIDLGTRLRLTKKVNATRLPIGGLRLRLCEGKLPKSDTREEKR